MIRRNFRQTCDQIQGLDLSAWTSNDQSDFTTEHEELITDATTTTAPVFDEIDLDSDIIRDAVEKAKKNLNERKQFEYEAWLAREYLADIH